MTGRRLMRVDIASEPGSASRANEDAGLHVGALVGVFDGVTKPLDIDTGCEHGPAWYVRRLTSRLRQVVEQEPGDSLASSLAGAIQRVRADHGGRCDLDNPATPAATVCLLRAGVGVLEYLILSDCTLVIDQGRVVTALTDERFMTTIARLRVEAPAGTFLKPVPGKYALTNKPGGYWIAGANPQAANEAVTGRFALSGPERVRRAALLTDGASCAVEQYKILDWRQLLDVCTQDGPGELIRLVRQTETADPAAATHPRYKQHDDATAALCVFEE
ncbi:protein phosphatase 2C domain-containing protein [Winogradskya consettensis]|uniref:Protein phosphatase 2C-like protein n=1 Tax=Winogradskya consettensis TaxID=113560 RepID=A0A919T3R7_9ACTN|nr:hypothetical protein [Actinoplanes consettensis]GIM83806.1 hypothetical protein Aco04nite_88330 [Actinoplanes consettensis]